MQTPLTTTWIPSDQTCHLAQSLQRTTWSEAGSSQRGPFVGIRPRTRFHPNCISQILHLHSHAASLLQSRHRKILSSCFQWITHTFRISPCEFLAASDSTNWSATLWWSSKYCFFAGSQTCRLCFPWSPWTNSEACLAKRSFGLAFQFAAPVQPLPHPKRQCGWSANQPGMRRPQCQLSRETQC